MGNNAKVMFFDFPGVVRNEYRRAFVVPTVKNPNQTTDKVIGEMKRKRTVNLTSPTRNLAASRISYRIRYRRTSVKIIRHARGLSLGGRERSFFEGH